MTNDNRTQNSNDKASLLNLRLDNTKLDFLRMKHRNQKFSYADAYIYILYNAMVSDQSGKDYTSAETTPMLVTNFSQLAKDWHWDRATVRNFVKQLQDLGLLLFEQQGKVINIYIID